MILCSDLALTKYAFCMTAQFSPKQHRTSFAGCIGSSNPPAHSACHRDAFWNHCSKQRSFVPDAQLSEDHNNCLRTATVASIQSGHLQKQKSDSNT